METKRNSPLALCEDSTSPPQAIEPKSNQIMKATKLPTRNGFAKFAAISGPLAFLFLLLMLPMSGFLPPKPPLMPTDKVVAHYISHETSLKGGVALMTLVGVFWPLFTAGIGGQLSRIPGMPMAVIYAQLMGGCLAGVFIILPSYLFANVIYRLDRPPEITQALQDQAWLIFVMPFSSLIAQDMAFSYGILLDNREKPLYPRWVAYITSSMTLLFWPALGTHCVHSGPIAWNGALSFWLPAVGGGVEMFFMSLYTYLAACRTDLPADGKGFVRTDGEGALPTQILEYR